MGDKSVWEQVVEVTCSTFRAGVNKPLKCIENFQRCHLPHKGEDGDSPRVVVSHVSLPESNKPMTAPRSP